MKYWILIILSFCALSCWNHHLDPQFVKEIDAWHQQRIAELTKPDGWLSLAGLFWLKEGENRFGADNNNDLVFPADKAPSHLGSYIKTAENIRIAILPTVEVLDAAGNRVTEREIRISDKADILTCGSLSWLVIKRGERYGVRLRDREHPQRKNFQGINRFPVDPKWRVVAQFAPYQPVKSIKITNVLGQVQEQSCPGALVFKSEEQVFRLDVLDEGKMFFVIFSDKTSGEETYGSGRFLDANKPDSTGRTVIDFNKAYNPPCAFTAYATCPLPPKQNRLEIAVQAGEKKYQGSH